MGGRYSKQQKEYEAAILEHLGRLQQQIDNLTESQHKPSSFSGIIPGLLSASSTVNGTVKGGDVVVSVLMCVAGISTGGVTACTLWLSGAEWINPALPLWAGTAIGFSVCSLRLLYDGILYDLWSAFQREPKEEEKSQSPPPVVRPLPVYSPQNPAPAPVVMYQLPGGQQITFDDLQHFLKTAVEEYPQWGTKAWSRESWTGKMTAGYPPLGNLSTRVWAGLRELCTEWAEQYPAFTDKDGRSTVWQSGDSVTVDAFLQMLADPDDDE